MFHNSDVQSFTLAQNALSSSRGEVDKRTGDGESGLPHKRVRLEDAGAPHRSEEASFVTQRLRLQLVSLLD